MRSLRSTSSLTLILASLPSLVAACGGAPDRSPSGSSRAAVTEKCGESASGPVQGVDVSDYQGDFDWAAAHVQFGYAQVSDGLYAEDSTFDGNWSRMKSAGVLRGAYQYFEPDQDEVAQANLVVSRIGRLGAGDLPAMIDVETTGGLGGSEMGAKIAKWLEVVEAGTGKKPIIYTGSYFWEDSVGTNLGSYPIWIAAYGTSCPSIPDDGWSNWTIWQYSDGGGSLDHDVFNGTLSQLKALGGDASPPPPADPAIMGGAVAWGPNRLDVFVRGADDALWHQYWDGSKWAGFQSLGGWLAADPIATSWGENRLDVFARGGDNALYHKYWDGSQWVGFEHLGGSFPGTPSAVSWSVGRLDVFVRGDDDQLYHQYNDGSWHSWQGLGAGIAGDPVAVSWAEGRLDVFARGASDELWHEWWDGSGWGPFQRLGGTLDSPPAVVSWGVNRLDVFARSNKDTLLHDYWSGSAWSPLEDLGGELR
jgi:GH25 family lysozyme M1 (1,4-beta-N-acetylmuramidase)